MSEERIRKTHIWKRTLEEKKDDEYKNEREKLRQAFLSSRKKISILSSRISSALPELTQHDITHIDALWEIASLIIGESFPLTPLEGFVLGEAFLIHDSALCFEAYKNGKEGLRSTIQWKDSFAYLKESKPNLSTAELEHSADFTALRTLHAAQAQNLLDITWEDSSISGGIYLLDDQDLRIHLAKLIGLIAGSHHWDIEEVMSRFGTQQNAPVGFPREWRIDPLKLACILRCADAAHIDNERAPDFLHVLLKRSGLSYNHWKAQNRLANADIDQSDSSNSTLIYTSTIDFKEVDSEAWFVAYDAVCLVDQELRSCNAVLDKRNLPTFQIQKVKGVDSPSNMAQYIKANGWQPCSAKIHVGNIEKVISNLGGEMLYGSGSDVLGIAIRELIQNARDAIKARSVFETDFQGKITLQVDKDDTSYWLTIEDNGIGMSERVLTGPLLDFGTSFWTSSLVQSEFPGLKASNYKPIGKFGIGFFSIFMISDRVFVASKNYFAGLSDTFHLKFSNGLSLRPILTKEIPNGFSSHLSTKIRFQLKQNLLPPDLKISIKPNRLNAIPFDISFRSYLAALCAGLDVNVTYKEQGKSEVLIHTDISSNSLDKIQWLKDISFSDFQPDSFDVNEYISLHVDRLKPVIEDGKTVGLAAINTKIETNQGDFLGVDTVGGLVTSLIQRPDNNFIGFMDHIPKSAKRDIYSYSASPNVIQDWAEDQLKTLLKLNLTPIEKYVAASALCHFKTDPTLIAQILVISENQNHFMSFSELAEVSKKKGVVFLSSGFGGGHMETHITFKGIDGHILVIPIMNSSFLSLKLINGLPENNYSILGCLHRSIIQKGHTPIIKEAKSLGTNNFGQKINAIIISSS